MLNYRHYDLLLARTFLCIHSSESCKDNAQSRQSLLTASYQQHTSISPHGSSMSDSMLSNLNHVQTSTFSCQVPQTTTPPFGQTELDTSLFASACVRLRRARMWRSSGQVWRDWLTSPRVGPCLSPADAVSALPSVVLPCRTLQPLTGRPARRLTRSALGPQTIVPPPLTSCPLTTSRLPSAPNSCSSVFVHLTCTIYQVYPPPSITTTTPLSRASTSPSLSVT